jgi:hypothetical protein
MKNDMGLGEHLRAVVEELTEENQKYVLGMLQVLSFAQSTQNLVASEPKEKANPGVGEHVD